MSSDEPAEHPTPKVDDGSFEDMENIMNSQNAKDDHGHVDAPEEGVNEQESIEPGPLKVEESIVDRIARELDIGTGYKHVLDDDSAGSNVRIDELIERLKSSQDSKPNQTNERQPTTDPSALFEQFSQLSVFKDIDNDLRDLDEQKSHKHVSIDMGKTTPTNIT